MDQGFFIVPVPGMGYPGMFVTLKSLLSAFWPETVR